MPHCIIEHSENLSAEPLIESVFNTVVASGLFSKNGDDVKLRAAKYSGYKVGNSSRGFVHVVLKILSGRSTEQKTELAKIVLGGLQGLAIKNCSFTVEVVDIDTPSYAKLEN
ncbi:5-carboxymethyl-2-hydroxymuconate Delta-isomerase [uncultured Pseudoteredinibacter sp.]|uniref:5-carboxymethyl-2-hydroxymuconate Delta-isomerase n=1 Tax=uncultured Pseudoteredinibacter sp. TaxID=1641701 RepID=UPI00261D5DD0|nr:5-carboxymethyl-2-hydroxymuconate Delta-isomerase [uncultured Pseudoteredinibacter sp.]